MGRRRGRVRRESTTTRRKRLRASDHRIQVEAALAKGHTLRVSNRTTDTTVHHGLAHRLVREGRASYRDLQHITAKEKP